MARGIPLRGTVRPLADPVLDLCVSLEGEAAELIVTAEPLTVHESRKDSRRLRLWIRLLRAVLPPYEKYWRRQLRVFRNALAGVRDLDVQVAWLEALSDSTDPSVETLAALLRSRRAGSLGPLRTASGELMESGVLAAIPGTLKGEMEAAGTWKVLTAVSRACIDMSRDLEERLPLLSGPLDSSAFHRVRISARKLRYALEYTDALLPETFREALLKVTELQENLGLMHDAWIMAGTLVGEDIPASVPEGLVNSLLRLRKKDMRESAEAAVTVARTSLSAEWFTALNREFSHIVSEAGIH